MTCERVRDTMPLAPRRAALAGKTQMAITQDSVVTLHYTLKDDEGKTIDSSSSGEPLAYLHGHGNLVPGLERELAGKNPGDKFSVKITPADGYGEFNKALVQKVPRRALKDI